MHMYIYTSSCIVKCILIFDTFAITLSHFFDRVFASTVAVEDAPCILRRPYSTQNINVNSIITMPVSLQCTGNIFLNTASTLPN